jgi:DNA polymerase-4
VGVRRRSMGTQHALGRRRRSPEELDAVLVGIVDRIARRLRGARRVCRTVVLRLRFQDFTRATRSHTLPHATQQTEPILATARALLAAVMPTVARQGLTLLGISLTNLEDASDVQLVFAFERRHAIDEALDSVRDRFGTTAITRAVLLGREQSQPVPLLPD